MALCTTNEIFTKAGGN
ncbi:hypothetical protein HYQ46_013444 [Verticillium longisporum]|nr:hypothetical protein HYQ46_013444 [Verticillium longisporum]